MARTLLLLSLMLPAVFGPSCVIPPPLPEVSGDNRPPRLLLEKFSKPKFGELFTTVPKDLDVFTIDGALLEPDAADDVTVRVFKEGRYDNPVPIDPTVIRGPGFAGGERTLRIRIVGLCDTQFTGEGLHLLELYISDRGFVTPSSRAAKPDGGRDSVAWQIDCIPANPGSDGGP